jgi:[acyl-carrier-protein] S-malonyltransferase
VFVIAAPGQGAQQPGFLRPWLELPGFADRLTWWSAVTGLDLVRYGTTAGEEEIRDTAVAQPLLVAAGIAAAAELRATTDAANGLTAGHSVAAGHSVGELVAAVLSGVLSPEVALVFVRERGRAMAEAAAVTETGMSAVLGGQPDDVLAAIDKHDLTPANINGAGQIVAAGTLAQLAAFAEDPPTGARLRPLQVAGAFHTEHMHPAVAVLRRLVPGMPIADPLTTLLSNGDGEVVTSGADYVAHLVEQVSRPVRWDACMTTMAGLGVTAIIELPPAGTLTGLAKRALPDVTRVALKTPDDLDSARELIRAHASQAQEDNK